MVFFFLCFLSHRLCLESCLIRSRSRSCEGNSCAELAVLPEKSLNSQSNRAHTQYTLACNTSEAWAFSVIAQLSLENWHSPLFFERKMPLQTCAQHRIESDLIWMNLQLRKAVEQVPEKRNKVAPFHHKAHTPFKSQESLEPAVKSGMSIPICDCQTLLLDLLL